MRTPIALALFSALCACNNGSSTATLIPELIVEPTLEITEDNAQQALQAGVRAALDVQRIGLVGARFIRVPRPEVEDEDPNVTTAPQVLPATMSVDITGPQGGTAVFTWEDRQRDGIYSTGDVFTITCDGYKAEKMTFTGSILLDNVRLQGDPGEVGWKFDADCKLQGVNVSWGATDFDLTMTLPVYLEDRIVTEVFRTYLPENVFIGPWEVYAGSTFEHALGQSRYSLAFDGIVYSADLDGILKFETEAYLEGLNLAFLNGPSFGNFFVVGANGTRLENELDLTNFAMTINPREEENEMGVVEMVNDGVLTISWTTLLP